LGLRFHVFKVLGLTKIYLKIYNILRSLLVSGILLMRKELGMEDAPNHIT